MVHRSSTHPGWVEGWAVVRGSPRRWEIAGVYDTEAEAQAARAAKGDGYTVRWGSYCAADNDFVTGDPE